jgi:dTDP-4-dehydrorhamnose reductase
MQRTDVCANLADATEVSAALDPVSPEVIVNLAALTDVDECERAPNAAYRANTRIVMNLARWIHGRPGRPCHLIQLSTDQVYDGAGPHREDDVSLTNYYAFSKYSGELAAALVESTVLRTNFFGRSRRANRSSISDWLYSSLIGGRSITVFDDVRFSPLSLPTLVGLLEVVVRTRNVGVFNLGSTTNMSKADFAFSFAQALDLPVDLMSRGSSDSARLTAYRPKDMSMDCSGFQEAFQVRLPTLTQEIQLLRETYREGDKLF